MNPDEEDLPPEGVTDHLAQGAQMGDRARFCALYERVAPAVYGWARLRLPAELHAVIGPEDIVQEVWLGAMGTLSGFDPDQGSFRRWVFGIARNVWRNAIRRAGKEATPGYKEGRFDLEAIPEEATAVSVRASRKEGIQELIVACEDLTPGDRELLLLRGLEGHSHEDVASELGVEAGAVRKRWQRLRQRFEGIPGLSELIEA